MSMTTLPDTQWLELELSEGWLRIFLNAPESRNALSQELGDEIKAVLRSVRNDPSVRGITLRGRGRVFCAGGDLKAFSALSGLSPNEAYNAAVAISLDGAELFSLVHTAPQVVVALIEGAAVAGGLGMACAADFAYATPEAIIAFSETQIGLPPAQIAPYVIAKTGIKEARGLLLLGDRLDGVTACRVGLIDEVADSADQLEELEIKLRARVKRCAPGAVGVTKNVIDDVIGLDIEQFQRRAADHFAHCLTGSEGREGVASFFAKRKPSWATSTDG